MKNGLSSFFGIKKKEVVKPIPMVSIRWSDFFNPGYVRRVDTVQRQTYLAHDGIPYGVITESEYLPEEMFSTVNSYRHGDIFVVREGDLFGGLLKGATIDLTKPLKKCMYFLVQVNHESDTGYNVIDIVEEHVGYPWHENTLVASMFRNKLFAYETYDPNIEEKWLEKEGTKYES